MNAIRWVITGTGRDGQSITAPHPTIGIKEHDTKARSDLKAFLKQTKGIRC